MTTTKKERDFVEALTQTTVNLIMRGTLDPSCEDITEAYVGDLAVGGGFEEDVRKKLPKIFRQIEMDYGWTMSLVNRTYYRRFHGIGIATMEEAKSCLPHNGKGNDAYGIRRCSDDDLIFRAEIERNMKAGAGKTRRGTQRVLSAHAHDDVSDENVLALLENAQDWSLPPEAKLLLAQVQRLALEAGNGEDEAEIVEDESDES